jgi:hypothetical protein
VRRKGAGIRFVAAALDGRSGPYLVLGLIAVHAVTWTIILTISRSGSALPKFIAAAISFYGADHPVLFTNFDPRIATPIDPEALERSGFAAICLDATPLCESAVVGLSTRAERITFAQRPNPLDSAASALRWSMYLVAPRERDGR